jgi:hypothetical protein
MRCLPDAAEMSMERQHAAHRFGVLVPLPSGSALLLSLLRCPRPDARQAESAALVTDTAALKQG